MPTHQTRDLLDVFTLEAGAGRRGASSFFADDRMIVAGSFSDVVHQSGEEKRLQVAGFGGRGPRYGVQFDRTADLGDHHEQMTVDGEAMVGVVLRECSDA